MKKSKDKPLTLDALVHYHQKVLIPDLEERFVAKDEFKQLRTELKGHKNEFTEFRKGEFTNLKSEFTKFKDESLSNQDAILKKLDILLEEKEVEKYQKEKEKKMWLILIGALKEHKILTPKQLKQIAQLDIF